MPAARHLSLVLYYFSESTSQFSVSTPQTYQKYNLTAT